MENRQLCCVETAANWICRHLREDRVPMLAALIAGLAAHGFAFSNKLLNADEVSALFGKGETVLSGRWALGLTDVLFPNLSMPWIYGLLSLLMLTASVCVILRLFSIRRALLQIVLAALIVSFPAQVSVFTFMFTSPSYALALLLAVLGVYLSEKEDWPHFGIACMLMVLSLGIYQAYVSFMAGFFVLRMIQMLLKGEREPRAVFFYGLRRLALLTAALLIYYGIALLALHMAGGEFVDYAVERKTGILSRAVHAYSALLHTFTRGYFGFVRSGVSLILHGLIFCACLLLLARRLPDTAKRGGLWLLLLCLALLPLAINCIFLIASVEVIYSPVMFGFVCLYVFAAFLAEEGDEAAALAARDCILVALAVVVMGNVYFANKAYLKMHIDYENAYALYTGVAAQIRSLPEFDENCTIALVGDTGQGLFHDERLDVGDLGGVNKDMVNTYMKSAFMHRYVGFDVPYADRDTCWLLSLDERVAAMPSYPYYGSIQRIDDYIVVKLGD